MTDSPAASPSQSSNAPDEQARPDRAIYERHEKSDRRMLVIAVLVIGLVNFAFVVEDGGYSPTGEISVIAVGLRSLLLVASIAFAVGSRFIKTVDGLQRATLAWQLVMSTGFVLLDSSIPSDSNQHSLADLCYLIAIFLFMPNRLSYQMISGAYFAAAHIWMIYEHGQFSNLWWEAAFIFPIAGICAAYISWRMHQIRSDEYKRWVSERDSRVKLEDAMAKIHTLRGLLPICAYCKKVRDDTGYWHEVETYIRRNSPAEFSHSLCPDCGQEHYPEFLCEEDFRSE